MEDKILIVGDLHGEWGRLNTLIQRKHPTMVLQCGDFGWWPKMEAVGRTLYHTKNTWKLKGIKSQGAQVLWCDGNHEDHWDLAHRLPDYPDTSVEVYSGVYYIPRGVVMVLPDGRNALFMGGADSVDKNARSLGVDWFPEEIITQRELDRALSYDFKIDIVISHTCPKEWTPGNKPQKYNDPSREALSRILEKYKPELWYCGHWHTYAEGRHGDTRWTALDYPGHGGRWWVELESV